jgi:hypothetical protein
MSRIYLLVAFMLTLFFQAKSQNILPAERMDLIMEVAPNDSTVSANDTTFSSNTQVVTKVIIILQDTVHLSKIHVKLGSSNNSFNLLNKYFSFDALGDFSDGTNYTRVGSIVYLNLGTRLGLQNCFAEIKLEDTIGRFTEPVNLSGN